MAQAADNTVLVDAATHEKAKMMTGIEFTALEPILFKGFATPQVTYQPMRSNKGSPAKQIAMSAKLGTVGMSTVDVYTARVGCCWKCPTATVSKESHWLCCNYSCMHMWDDMICTV